MTFSRIRRIDDDAQRVSKFIFEKTGAIAEAVLYRPAYRSRAPLSLLYQGGL